MTENMACKIVATAGIADTILILGYLITRNTEENVKHQKLMFAENNMAYRLSYVRIWRMGMISEARKSLV